MLRGHRCTPETDIMSVTSGSLATALNVIYEIWYIIVIILFLLFENMRLRVNRKAHAAAVMGLAQGWL